MGFKEKLKELKAEFPYEVSLCLDALRKERKNLETKREQLLLERSGIPVEGLFGEPLLKEFDEKFNDIQIKLNKL